MKEKFFKAIPITFYTSVALLAIVVSAYAGTPDSQNLQLTKKERLSLARSFVKKMKSGFSYADSHLLNAYDNKDPNAGNILQDGEALMFQPVLSNNVMLDGLILSEYQNGKILVSLKDFSDILQLAIEVNEEAQTAKGWYISEDKIFSLDMATLSAKTDHGEFQASPETFFREGDVYIPLSDLEQWLDIKFEPTISTQQLKIDSNGKLPIEKQLARRKLDFRRHKVPEPILPRLKDDDYKLAEIPVVDVATSSTYRRRGNENSEAQKKYNATIRTVGDLAYGTFTTQSRLNNDEQLVSVTANYRQDSAEAELLGPLKARRFEVGDVLSTNFDLGGNVSQSIGARVTNTDPLRTFSSPTTDITGQGFPGWDVELYRDETLIAFQEINEDGYYVFENVDLFNSDNNFRVVFYGPQGEMREESIYIPIDRSRLANRGGIYDVSVNLDGKRTYEKSRFEDEDEGAVNVTAHYEHPVLDASAVSASFRSNEHEGERNYVAAAGLSTTVLETLVNADVAADDEGEMAARLVARKNIGKHDLINTLDWIGPNFDTEGDGNTNDIGNIKNTFHVIGPLPFPVGKNPRYSINASYNENTEGDSSAQISSSFNTNIKRVSINEQLTYQTSDHAQDDTLHSISNLTTNYGRNRFRFLADYEIKPESELDRVFVSYQRDITRDIDVSLEVERQYNQKLNEFTAKLDWQAGFIRLSPQVTYNSNRDFYAVLNTRFGVLKDPQRDKLEFFDRNVSNNGGLSAFVFLDANGDGQYNEGEEKLKDIVVRSIQNGGFETTDENGIAIFTRMQELRLTDVKVDSTSLQDPTWVVGFEGVSVLPRKGHVTMIEFPIHISGEIDGTIYARNLLKDENMPLRNITVELFNDEGEIEQTTTSDSTGFYYFSSVPPGRYLLLVSQDSAEKANFSRAMPQAIEIGYDGTVIYGNNIIVESGKKDIPSEIKADIDDYKARHPHIDFEDRNYEIVLNMGEYNSRLLMSVIYYKLKTRYLPILSGGTLMVPPAESYADEKTGKHTLRFGLKDISIEEAYQRCKALSARDMYCKVEIFPSIMKQAKIDPIPLMPEEIPASN